MICVSRYTRDRLLKLMGDKLAPERVEVIPNGVDTELFSYAPPRLEELSSGRPLRLLQSGTMTAWQGVLLAVEAEELVL